MPWRLSWRGRFADSWDFIKEVYIHFTEDRNALAAGAISFFTILSLIPLLLLAVTFAAPQLNSLLENIQHALGTGPQGQPSPLFDELKRQIEFVSTQLRLSTIVALVFGFWSGSQVFLILESAMNVVWHAVKRRPFWLRRLIAFLMVIIAGALLVCAFILANMLRFLEGLEIPVFGRPVGDISWLIGVIVTALVPVLLISALFAIIYRILPAKRVTLRSVIPGAIISGILWLISLHFFGWYTAAVFTTRYKVLYGSLAGIILLMLWFYYSAFIMLLGAEISATYHRRLVEAGDKEERLVEQSEQPVGAAEIEERLALARKLNEENSLLYYGFRSEE